MKDCQNKSENASEHCTCTYEPCSRKGICCECVAYHNHHGEVPGCMFPTAGERTYDRSIASFIKWSISRGKD